MTQKQSRFIQSQLIGAEKDINEIIKTDKNTISVLIRSLDIYARIYYYLGIDEMVCNHEKIMSYLKKLSLNDKENENV